MQFKSHSTAKSTLLVESKWPIEITSKIDFRAFDCKIHSTSRVEIRNSNHFENRFSRIHDCSGAMIVVIMVGGHEGQIKPMCYHKRNKQIESTHTLLCIDQCSSCWDIILRTFACMHPICIDLATPWLAAGRRGGRGDGINICNMYT